VDGLNSADRQLAFVEPGTWAPRTSETPDALSLDRSFGYELSSGSLHRRRSASSCPAAFRAVFFAAGAGFERIVRTGAVLTVGICAGCPVSSTTPNPTCRGALVQPATAQYAADGDSGSGVPGGRVSELDQVLGEDAVSQTPAA
jgi:hypothetical protein